MKLYTVFLFTRFLSTQGFLSGLKWGIGNVNWSEFNFFPATTRVSHNLPFRPIHNTASKTKPTQSSKVTLTSSNGAGSTPSFLITKSTDRTVLTSTSTSLLKTTSSCVPSSVSLKASSNFSSSKPTSSSSSLASVMSLSMPSVLTDVGPVSSFKTSTSISTGSPPKYSTDGLCGANHNGLLCNPNNPLGPCCSQYGYCGNTEGHCLHSNKCQSGCSSESASIQPTSATSASPTSGFSQTKYCGSANKGLRCEPNGDYGPCCSKDGICGGGDSFCLPSNGCQNGCSIVSEPASAGCGDGFCDGRSETCFSCQSDCGTCDSKYIDNCVSKGQISLTFDDGPSKNGPLLLETAKSLDIKLTHFVIGNKLSNPQYQTFLRNFFAAGHAIASHTLTHPFMTHLTDNEIRAELIKTDDAIFNVIGVRPLFMRNPYADSNSRTMALIESMGYQSIFTSLDTEDTVYGGTSNKYKILENVQIGLNRTKVSPLTNSFVITQHETVIDSINYLPQIVQEIRNRGYTMPLIHTCRGAAQLYRNDICGDKKCSGYLENCSTCPQDCGACPR